MGPNFRDLSSAFVPGNGKSIYTMPWQTDNNILYTMPIYLENGKLIKQNVIDREYMAIDNPPSLPDFGKYYTGFTIQYNETDSVRMEVSFQVF